MTIMSSLAQEESRSISENVIWGHRKRMADGKMMVPFSRFLGYDRGEDGNLVVNREEAKTIKLIYGDFLAYKRYLEIIKSYNAEQDRSTIEKTFMDLMDLAQSMSQEQQR